MSSKYRHVKHLTSKHTGCSDTTTDHSCTGSKNTGIRSLGTAKTELHDSITFRRIADTCCLGSDQALMVHNVQNRSFHKLSFHNRCYHFHHWLSWENNSAFRDGINIAGKMEGAKIFQKILLKNGKTAKIFDICVCKSQILNIFNYLLQSCTDSKTASAWVITVKHVEYDSLVSWVLKIPLHHGKFIKIREQSQVICSHVYSPY